MFVTSYCTVLMLATPGVCLSDLQNTTYPQDLFLLKILQIEEAAYKLCHCDTILLVARRPLPFRTVRLQRLQPLPHCRIRISEVQASQGRHTLINWMRLQKIPHSNLRTVYNKTNKGYFNLIYCCIKLVLKLTELLNYWLHRVYYISV